MCLYSKTRIPKIATKDIAVYKIVIQTSDGLITPYIKCKVSKIMQVSFIDCIKGILSIRFTRDRYEINGGFIHSYKTYLDAKFIRYWIEFKDLDNRYRYKILKGIIPKGSIYYKDKTTYCSNKLILDL